MSTGNVYIDMVMIACITVFCLDISDGMNSIKQFITDCKSKVGTILSGKKYIAKYVDSIKPFDCSLCMIWWLCILYLLLTMEISFINIGIVSVLASLNQQIANVYYVIQDTFAYITNKVLDILKDK